MHFVPEGRYRLAPDYINCSPMCWHSQRVKHCVVMKCGCGCGTQFIRKARPQNAAGLIFVSPQHYGFYARNKRLAEACGEFREIVYEYLEGFATMHYRDVQHVRSALILFFRFINKQSVSDLERVTPKVVTKYLPWAKESTRCVSPSDLSCISKFFQWMIAEGRRTAENPVISLMHSPRKKHRLPRPLETEELDLAWKLLHLRGTARLRFAAAAAEDSGLRLGEICRLHIEDVDIYRRKLFIRLPNKANRERWAFFGDKTKRYYIEWMAERNANCGHDFVLHNSLGNPLRVGLLGAEFRRVLCKTSAGKPVNQTGFEKWSTHRLRHTMASRLVSAGADAATVMAAGGWKSYQAMAGYARVSQDVVRRAYDTAMKRAQDRTQFAPSKKLLTPADLLARRRMLNVQPIPTMCIEGEDRRGRCGPERLSNSTKPVLNGGHDE